MQEIYISVDVEASGPVPATYSMLSLGAVVVANLEKRFYVELKPVNGNAVSDAMKIIGRTLEDFTAKGRDPREAMATFRGWLSTVVGAAKPVFVGFNAVFDWAFVNYYFHQYLGENPFGVSGIDIKSYYMGMTRCTWDETRSSRIRTEFRGASRHTHHALEDAIEQAEMFRRMVAARER